MRYSDCGLVCIFLTLLIYLLLSLCSLPTVPKPVGCPVAASVCQTLVLMFFPLVNFFANLHELGTFMTISSILEMWKARTRNLPVP